MASRPTSPVEPSKQHRPPIQPNAHPYAIKTTTSALLSRSNSSPHYADHTRHHYVPSSAPPRVAAGTRVRHRHASSLSAVEGDVHNSVRAPLPAPPSIVASPDNPSYEPQLTHRVRRADTMPSNATEPVTERHSYGQKRKYNHDRGSKPELGPSPRQWNTDELIAYLETSFMSCNGTVRTGKDDASLLEYVRTRGLTGRGLLRLTDGDLSGTPLSDIQRARLLECSCTLRTDVLRSRIYVDSYPSHEVADSSNDTLSARSSTPFRSVHGASVSAEDLRLLSVDGHDEGISALPPPPVVTLHRSNSVSDASAQRYRDLACMRVRRRGRVKGLVETWERASASGSECSTGEEGSLSGSEAESESENDAQSESILDTHRLPVPSSEMPSAVPDAPRNDIRSPTTDFMGQEAPSLTPPPPYAHLCTAREVVGDEEEEPSIEELLASSSSIPLKGARAWEADFGLGETVKGIPVSTSAGAENPPLPPMKFKTSRDPMDDTQQSRSAKRSGVCGSTGSIGKKVKTQKRIVTAIFTGSPTDDVSEKVGDEVRVVEHHRRASGVDGVVRGEAPSLDPQHNSDSSLRALEESIAATRAQMDAFRVRLEQLEADTAHREAELKQVQYTDDLHSSGRESRQLRSEAGVQAIAEPARDTGTRDKNVLHGGEAMSLCDITRAIVARAVRWLFPDGRLSVPARDDHSRRLGVNDMYPSPAKRGGGLRLARISCSILMVSFALCAVVLRRMGFGKWVRRS